MRTRVVLEVSIRNEDEDACRESTVSGRDLRGSQSARNYGIGRNTRGRCTQSTSVTFGRILVLLHLRDVFRVSRA